MTEETIYELLTSNEPLKKDKAKMLVQQMQREILAWRDKWGPNLTGAITFTIKDGPTMILDIDQRHFFQMQQQPGVKPPRAG